MSYILSAVKHFTHSVHVRNFMTFFNYLIIINLSIVKINMNTTVSVFGERTLCQANILRATVA